MVLFQHMYTNIKISYLIIILILLSATFLRLYKLNEIPPSISWDEAANGYNAWSIANFGKDEWNKTLPLFFKSFEDDKHPVHIYITSIFIFFMRELNEFTTRLPAAVFGILNVLMIFLLGRRLLKSDVIALAAAFTLAVSLYNLQFSRMAHELNFTIFFFMLGLYLFIKGIEEKSYLLSVSFLSFGVSMLSYHSAKVVVPPIIILLVLFYWKNLLEIKRNFIIGIVLLGVVAAMIALNPELLGIARAKQTSFSGGELAKTKIYQSTQNLYLARAEIILTQYLWHFDPQFLFISGDKNPRLSAQVGEFYKIEAIFLGIGFIYLLNLIRKGSKVGLILLAWFLLAPLPSSLAKEAPHASRAMFMTGSWHLVAAMGFYTLMQILKKRYLMIAFTLFVLIVYGRLMQDSLDFYYNQYSKKYAIDWQYGMKQIVSFVKDNPKYYQVYMTDIRSQPYIFFLYYLQTPPEKFFESADYNTTQSRSYNLVSFYDRFYFGGWDFVESMPNQYVLYVVTDAQYDGLRHKNLFQVKEKINFPNGGSAFYLVSAN